MSHFNIACLRVQPVQEEKSLEEKPRGGHNSVWKNILTKAANTGAAKITQQCGIQDKKNPPSLVSVSLLSPVLTHSSIEQNH